ncbi:MAG TPA: carboxypeptidase-like regulatory domain-containing protein [Planctomycetaceae bacterium]|nr:carboxypeptidase-like regulatory domain-containing protein [Planctomycetaceae bacterium]
MRGRSVALTLGLLILFCIASDARAHRLNAEYRLLPGKKVQIESWFDSTGESPKGATVQVFRPDGQLLIEGKLNEKGTFTFPHEDAGPLRVVVSAGQGHRKEFTIPASEFAEALSDSATQSNEAPLADRTSQVSVRDVLIGVGFLMAVAALALSIRNARRLRQ